MKKILMFVAFSFLILSCSPSKKLSNESAGKENISVTTDNDGSSFEKAIVIKEKSESKGVDAEYAWLRQNFPGYKSKGQALVTNKNNLTT